MRRTQSRLADGREIFYFDESPDEARDLVDRRPLKWAEPHTEIRWDPILEEWVVIAPLRQDRTFLPSSDQCPLCPSTPAYATEIPAGHYDVVVFENRFPSFASSSAEGASPASGSGPAGEGGGLFSRRAGVGRCEVVCFTSDHGGSLSGLSPARMRTVVAALADRSQALGALPGVEQVFCYENRGIEIGVTLSHPHGQIYAYPFVTPRSRRMLDSARRYRESTGRDLFGDVLASEERARVRVVAGSPHWTAFVPAAARWPYEIHLYPRRKVAELADLGEEELEELAWLYPAVLRQLESLDECPVPYVAAWHQAPVRVDRDLAYLHLELFTIRRAPGKLKYLAGSESGMGAFINDIAPEEAARRLREGGS